MKYILFISGLLMIPVLMRAQQWLGNTSATGNIYRDGNVGIGTTSPVNKLDVISGTAGTMAKNTYEIASFEQNGDAKLGIYTSSNSFSSAGAALTFGNTRAVNANSLYPGFELQFTPASAVADTYMRFNFLQRNSSGVVSAALADILNIYGDGRVSIGTTSVGSGYKLFVEEGIRTRKVKVDQANWPDYVFHANYRLRPLSEVEQYIKQYGHLPEMPSAEEVAKNGVDIGDNQALLLKKMEELTLYVIEQNKKIEALNKKIEDQNTVIAAMQKK